MTQACETSSWSRPLLLVVTHHEAAFGFCALKSSMPYTFLKANSWEEARDTLHLFTFALLLLDFDVLTVDVRELIHDIRSQPFCERMPLIFLSESTPPAHTLINLYQSEGVDLVLKSLPLTVIEARIKLLLGTGVWIPIFQDAPIGMFLTLGPQHIFARANEMFLTITGLTTAILGKPIRHGFPEMEDSGVMAILDEAWESGKACQALDIFAPFRPGMFLDLSCQPLLNEKGAVYGIVTRCYDVTEKVQSRRALERSCRSMENETQNLGKLFRHMPNIICKFLGPAHRFEFVNDAHIRVLGFDATGMTIREAQPESVEAHRILDDVYRSGKIVEIHEQPVTLQDRQRYFNLTCCPRWDEEGRIMGVIGLGVEVTEQIASRRALAQSHARFQQLADSMPQLVYVSNAEGNVMFLNQGWRDYTGVYEQALGNRRTIESIHPDDQPGCMKAWAKAMVEKTRFDCEIRLRSRAGTYRWFVSRAVPNIVQGTLVEWFGTSTDIHDQKMAAEELARSREHYRIVFEASPVPMWLIDPDSGQYLDVNETALQIYGYMRDEFLRLKMSDLLPAEDIPEHQEAMRSPVLLAGEFLHTQSRHKRKDGSIVHVEVTMRDLILEGRRLRMAAMVDVTARVMMEGQLRELMQNLQAAKEEAEKANELKSAFLANMSHEIRTPLGAMLGFADLLRDSHLTPEERSTYIDILMRNGEQLSIIINDILDLSKVEAGHLNLEFVDVDPRAIVEDVLSLMTIKAREKGLTLEYEADPSTPHQLTSDPVRVRQVLLNLLSNAIKFTAHGRIQIRSYAERNGQGRLHLSFEITDTGIGMVQDQVDHIFEMFVQADGSITRKFGGTGLGLALSRKLAHALGGNVRVIKSQPGVGSTFLFTLTDLPELRDNQPKIAPAEPTLPLETEENASLEGVKVLVVDDAPDIQLLISHLLLRAGAVVDSADNGADGYRKALSDSYDMILMDIQMPLMDGYTATMKLREQGYQKPIIALTAHAMTEARKKCLSVGCTGHLPKPINPHHLLGTVSYYVRH